MTLTILPELLQGADEWHDQRRGIVTASAVGNLISVGSLSAIDYDCPECSAPANEPCQGKRKPGPIKTLHTERAAAAAAGRSTLVLDVAKGDTAQSLTLNLVAERITGYTEPVFVNDDMMRGHEEEPLARDKYAEHYAPVTEVGFMVEDKWGFRIGYSPDGLVGDDGLIEIKSRRQKKQLSTILSGNVPAENMAQLQTGLLVSGRKWIDYISYSGGMPMWPKRVYPDQQWFDAITNAVRHFEDNAREMMRLYDESVVGLPLTERITLSELEIF